jgi:hypothetical protein
MVLFKAIILMLKISSVYTKPYPENRGELLTVFWSFWPLRKPCSILILLIDNDSWESPKTW